MGSPRTEEPALAVTISRQGDDLAWQVQNVGKQDVWAFLLVPSIVDGRKSFAVETAWLEEESEGTLVVRKVDTPIPPGVLVDDAIRSGAILMKPGESRQGRLGGRSHLAKDFEGLDRRRTCIGVQDVIQAPDQRLSRLVQGPQHADCLNAQPRIFMLIVHQFI